MKKELTDFIKSLNAQNRVTITHKITLMQSLPEKVYKLNAHIRDNQTQKQILFDYEDTIDGIIDTLATEIQNMRK